jgi:hypothetical protein
MTVVTIFRELINRMEGCDLGPGSGSVLSLMEDLPGEFIVGHYHPAMIHDPLLTKKPQISQLISAHP